MNKELLRSTSIFSAMTLISRMLGFVRDMVVAHFFGATGVTDAFFVAFKIPNFMRRLFAEGAFSQAFVPILAEYKQQRSHSALQQFIDHIAGTLGVILLILTVLGVVAAPLLIMLFSPGFPQDGSRFDLATQLLRITFPYILFISLTAFAGGILNVHNHFAASAFTPVFLNLAMIAAVLWVAPYLQHPINALAWAVFCGGLIQLFFQYPFLRRLRLIPHFKWKWRDAGVQRVLKLMLPAIFGVSIMQIGLLIDTMFASFLPKGSISWLYTSERLMLFPLGVFGVALATVVMPHLAKKFADKSAAAYASTMDWAIQSVLLLGIPAAIGLMMLSGPLITSLFNYGKFNQLAVLMSQRSLVAYALGVPFMMLVKVLAAGFYARQNIRTPVKVAVVALMVNLLFNFVLIASLQHAGLALASSIAAFVNSMLLWTLLIKYKIVSLKKSWWLFLFRCIIANSLMAVLIYILTAAQSVWFAWHWQQRCWHLLAIVLVAAIFYFAVLSLLGLKFLKRN